jgi:hypothetical protein
VYRILRMVMVAQKNHVLYSLGMTVGFYHTISNIRLLLAGSIPVPLDTYKRLGQYWFIQWTYTFIY